MSDEELGKELFGYLKQRRYLVVVHDIWSIEAWDNLEVVFPAEETNGSRVMLTTRNKEVALYADVDSIPHELRFLTEDECWELFCRRVFSKKDMSCMSTELEKVGREIVAKCRGLPLAVVVLAGILSRKKLIPNEWAKVLKNINRESGEGHNQIFRILSLSYEYLPYHLKSCFLYFAVFPEDFEIPARKLIRLWVAEGLARQIDSETEEEMAENHLKELIDRSMVQASTRRYNGEIRTCRIHDLLRDLAISEAKKDKFLDVQSDLNSASPSRARRLTIHGSIEKFIHLNIPTPHLRSLLSFTSQTNLVVLHKKDWLFLSKDFRLLRVLDLPRLVITRLPKEVGEMIHLRYLGLERGSVLRLPSTLCNFSRLHTLNIKPSIIISTQHLPSTINKMDQLRHLVINWGKLNERSRVDGLTNLQTLSMVVAGPWIKNGLDKLTSLRRLGIRDVLSCHKETLSESIVKLNCLHSLVLSAYEGNMLPTLMLTNHAHLYKLKLYGKLEKLPDLVEFPPNLVKLTLSRTLLTEDPMATLERLSLLRTLYLGTAAYTGKGMVCSAGGFPQLEKLELYYQDELEEWKLEEGAMLNLRRLYIQSFYKLKMLPEGLQHITTLQKLELKSMSRELKSRIHPPERMDRSGIRSNMYLPSSLMEIGND